jgi:membrane-bound lytic murein transglycosylase B
MNELNDINLKYQDIEQEARDKKAKADKEAAKKELEEAKAVAEQKAAIQMQGLDTALQGVQLIKGLFEKQKGVQKAAVIAESAIGIAKMIIANKLANVAALATPQAIASSGVSAAPVIAMNNISTGIGIAANIAATAKALKTLGGGSPPSSPSGGGGGAGGVMSPNFNVVGNSGLNQLGQLQQKPMKAYVVSGDMTTAQALDRNRIENATLVH